MTGIGLGGITLQKTPDFLSGQQWIDVGGAFSGLIASDMAAKEILLRVGLVGDTAMAASMATKGVLSALTYYGATKVKKGGNMQNFLKLASVGCGMSILLDIYTKINPPAAARLAGGYGAPAVVAPAQLIRRPAVPVTAPPMRIGIKK